MLTCVMIGTFLTCNGEPIGNIYMQQRGAPTMEYYGVRESDVRTPNICESRRLQSEQFKTEFAAYNNCPAYVNGAQK